MVLTNLYYYWSRTPGFFWLSRNPFIALVKYERNITRLVSMLWLMEIVFFFFQNLFTKAGRHMLTDRRKKYLERIIFSSQFLFQKEIIKYVLFISRFRLK